jgi:predicted phosphohydrolase
MASLKYTLLNNGPQYIDLHGKPFKFKNKKMEQDYISRCEDIWGVVPCDINWAMQTFIYKNV